MSTANSPVSICSNALLMLGAQPINDFTEKNDRARLVSNLYDGVRDSLLREHREAIEDRNSPIMSKEAADAILQEYNITNITIPDEGVTTLFIDNLTEQTKKRIEREQVYQRVPDTTGIGALSFTASLAGSMLDPSNLFLMAIPMVGEARAATLLGRSAQRFGQGALAGGAQSVAFQPLTTQAAAMEGENYTNLQALTNITRTVPFPKELKEYSDTKAKESMRTFVSEVVYRLKKAVEAEQDINR